MKKKIAIISLVFVQIALLNVSAVACQSRRDRIDKPEVLAEAAGITPGMIVGEGGAGSGYLTFYLAERTGPEGKVYANDINEGSLRSLSTRCRREGVTNIETVQGAIDDPLFPAGDLDRVVMLRALHDFTEKVAWLRNLKKYMKPDAVLVIFEEEDHHTDMSEEEITGYADAAGFTLIERTHLHNGIWLYKLRIAESGTVIKIYL
jgi:ubiquinone/menaquinone biosynthesis C-methylase UbiE